MLNFKPPPIDRKEYYFLIIENFLEVMSILKIVVNSLVPI